MSHQCNPGAGDLCSQSQLTSLFNSGITSAVPMSRDLGSSSSGSNPLGSIMGAEHSGTYVTTPDGSNWLIHKGAGYGNASQTVITPASNMSNAWRVAGDSYSPNATIGDLMRTSGSGYNALTDNCNHATARMPGSTVSTHGLTVQPNNGGGCSLL